MAVPQIPSLEESLQQLSSLFAELAAIHTALADKEERNAEDFRDVIERFDVVFRINNEYNDRNNEFNSASAALTAAEKKIEIERSKPTFEKVRFKMEQQLAASKAGKTEALKRLKEALARLIQAKAADNKFKVRRWKHGWLLYAAAIKEAAQKEMEIFVRIRDHLAGMSIDGSAPPQLEAQIAEKIAEPAPAPVSEPAVPADLFTAPAPAPAPAPEPARQAQPIVAPVIVEPEPEPIAEPAPYFPPDEPEPQPAAAPSWDEPKPAANNNPFEDEDGGNPFD
jgi:hypothetical protein